MGMSSRGNSNWGLIKQMIQIASSLKRGSSGGISFVSEIKLMANKDRGLFNLDEDLGELNDLSAKYPERLRSMTVALEAWKTEMERSATPQPGIPQ